MSDLPLASVGMPIHKASEFMGGIRPVCGDEGYNLAEKWTNVTCSGCLACRAPMTCDHEAQIRDLLEEREELLTEIVRLQRGNHPAGRALREAAEAGPSSTATDQLWRMWLRNRAEDVDASALAEALTERDAEHEGGGGA